MLDEDGEPRACWVQGAENTSATFELTLTHLRMPLVKLPAYAGGVRAWLARRGSALLLLAGVAMVLGALWRLGHALPFLLWVAEVPHPTDLLARHREVGRWFAGIPTGTRATTPDYPPASLALLWPLLGWLDPGQARWLWGVTATAALSLLAFVALEEGGARSRAEKLALLALPFAGYATSATLSVGQVGNHVVPALVAGLLLLRRGRGHWWEDVGGAALILFALAKPTLSAPFVWIVCFAIGRVRPAVLVIVGYAALTLFAASFQPGDLTSILTAWLVDNSPSLSAGTASLQRVLYLTGHEPWIMPATLVTLLALGGWVWRHRNGDLWMLMGVAALVARLGIHHRPYDDVLLLIPAIALFRLAVSGEERGGGDPLAWVLLALTWATILAPAQLFRYPQPFPVLLETGQAVVWVALLVFLALRCSSGQRIGRPSPSV